MIISYSKNFIYLHLEKCGGTSIEDAIMPFLDKKDIKIGGLNFEEDNKELEFFKKYGFGKHATASDIKKYFKDEWQSMHKIATVRDPQDMLTSFYYYIKQNFKKETEDNLFKIYYKTLEDQYPLDSFIKYVINHPFRTVQPFLSRLDDSVELFDIANIDNNWPHILKKLKIESNPQLNKLNKSIKPENISLQKSTIDLIRDAFKIDYDNIPKITGQNWK